MSTKLNVVCALTPRGYNLPCKSVKRYLELGVELESDTSAVPAWKNMFKAWR